MATKNTLTLALKGEVRASDFATAVESLSHLIDALTKDYGQGEPIEWVIEGLEKSSAILTLRGICDVRDARFPIQDIINHYEVVGQRLSTQSAMVGYSHAVKSHAERIVSVINGHVKSVRFETESADAEISIAPELIQDIVNYGAVRGRVQSMSNRGQLRFTLYDIMTDRAVSCYLSPGNESLMLEAWGRLAIVEGLVRRDPLSGHPTTVRKITDVRIYDDMNPKSYREAVGAAPGRLGDSTPEQAIRRGRDG